LLTEISKYDNQWRRIATKICNDKSLADDLVNDMYLKIYKINPEKWNKAYISYIIYHLFIDHVRNNKTTISIDTLLELPSYEEHITEIRIKVNLILNELGFMDREVLLHTHEKSLRKRSKELNMSHTKLHYKKQKALEKFKKTEGFKKLLNER